jgi:hypothetical protein
MLFFLQANEPNPKSGYLVGNPFPLSFLVLATIFVLGTKVPRSAGCTRSTQAQHGIIFFQVTSKASGRSFVVKRPRPIYKVDRWSLESRGYQVTRDIASEKAPIFQDKIWVVRSSDAWRKIWSRRHIGIREFEG